MRALICPRVVYPFLYGSNIAHPVRSVNNKSKQKTRKKNFFLIPLIFAQFVIIFPFIGCKTLEEVPMSKRKFAVDLGRAIDEKGLNQEQAGELLGVSRTTIGNWTDPENPIEPLPKRWKEIEQVFGIKCRDYFHLEIEGDRNAGVIIAKDMATVNAGCDFGSSSQFTVTLSREDYEIYTMFQRFGNSAMREKCLKQLKAIEAMTTI